MRFDDTININGTFYDVDPATGHIKTPGKFEGEPRYVPYFWDIGLNGMADTDDGETYGFDISDEDRARFPELKRRRVLYLFERSDGFVGRV